MTVSNPRCGCLGNPGTSRRGTSTSRRRGRSQRPCCARAERRLVPSWRRRRGTCRGGDREEKGRVRRHRTLAEALNGDDGLHDGLPASRSPCRSRSRSGSRRSWFHTSPHCSRALRSAVLGSERPRRGQVEGGCVKISSRAAGARPERVRAYHILPSPCSCLLT